MIEESELPENVKEILEVLQPDTRKLESLKVVGYKKVLIFHNGCLVLLLNI